MEVEVPPEDAPEAAPTAAEGGPSSHELTLLGGELLDDPDDVMNSREPLSDNGYHSRTVVAHMPPDEARKQRRFTRSRHKTEPNPAPNPEPSSRRLNHGSKRDSHKSSSLRDVRRTISHVESSLRHRGGQGEPAALKLGHACRSDRPLPRRHAPPSPHLASHQARRGSHPAGHSHTPGPSPAQCSGCVRLRTASGWSTTTASSRGR